MEVKAEDAPKQEEVKPEEEKKDAQVDPAPADAVSSPKPSAKPEAIKFSPKAPDRKARKQHPSKLVKFQSEPAHFATASALGSTSLVHYNLLK